MAGLNPGNGAPPKAGDGAGAMAPPTTNKFFPGAAARLLKPPCIAWEGARVNVVVLEGCCVGKQKIEFPVCPGNFDQSELELEAPAANIPENNGTEPRPAMEKEGPPDANGINPKTVEEEEEAPEANVMDPKPTEEEGNLIAEELMLALLPAT